MASSPPPAQTVQPPQAAWKQPHSPGTVLPPAKRQRMSPPLTSAALPSPYLSSPHTPFYNTPPSYQNFSLPNSYPPRLPNGTHNQIPNPGIMGPPQRPLDRPLDRSQDQKEIPEKYMDINDLSDLVTSAGVDLKREEELMAASYRPDRFTTNNNSSFNSLSSLSTSSHTSFDLSQNNFQSIGIRGNLPQEQPKKTDEEILTEKHKIAARTFSISQSTHLNNSFLSGNAMRNKTATTANDHGIKLPMEGLYDKIPPGLSRINGTTMTHPDSSTLTTTSAPAILYHNSHLVPIFSLLSLACEERIRALLEDAYALTRARQMSSSGIVPPEYSDLAVSADSVNGQVQTTTERSQTITQTSWDQPATPAGTPLGPQKTIAFPPEKLSITSALANLARRDRADEEARLKKRAERRARKAKAEAILADPNLDSNGVAPGLLGDRAPERTLTKKEREKLARGDMSEEAATRNANAVAARALGGAKYSWLHGGAGAGKSGAAGKTTGSSTSKNKTDTTNVSAVGKDGLPAARLDTKYGVWREDGTDGKKVQLRDWVAVLETDGRERKTLMYAMARMGNEVGLDKTAD